MRGAKELRGDLIVVRPGPKVWTRKQRCRAQKETEPHHGSTPSTLWTGGATTALLRVVAEWRDNFRRIQPSA